MSKADMARFLPPDMRFVAMDANGDWTCFVGRAEMEAANWIFEGIGGLPMAILPDIDAPWDESLTEIRPKPRWLARVGDHYWVAGDDGLLFKVCQRNDAIDKRRHTCGYDWGNETQAQAFADACKELAMKMHEDEE